MILQTYDMYMYIYRDVYVIYIYIYISNIIVYIYVLYMYTLYIINANDLEHNE